MGKLTLKQAKMSFEDACHYIKYGRHLNDAYKFRAQILEINYLPTNLPYASFAGQLAQDLRVDKNEVQFVNNIIKKYQLKTRFNKKGYIELYK